MKKILCLLGFMISLFVTPQTIGVLNKNECFVPPLDDMVVMDKYTFVKYHYTAEKYDTLKKQVKEYDSLVRIKDSIFTGERTNYESLISLKDQEIRDYSDGYKSMKNNLGVAIEKNERLEVDYKKLEEKHSKSKRWRNFFMGASALLAGFLYVSVTH